MPNTKLSNEPRRRCLYCGGEGEIGPGNDRYVCPHCNGKRYCPQGCS